MIANNTHRSEIKHRLTLILSNVQCGMQRSLLSEVPTLHSVCSYCFVLPSLAPSLMQSLPQWQQQMMNSKNTSATL